MTDRRVPQPSYNGTEVGICPKCGHIGCRVSEHFSWAKNRIAYKCPKCGIVEKDGAGSLYQTHVWNAAGTELTRLAVETKLS